MKVISICEWLRWCDEVVKIQQYYDNEGDPLGGGDPVGGEIR
jgi:hypothetical protein